MELLFRKYFWTLNLAFLLVAAYLAAKTVNVFVGASLAPVPDFSGQQAPKQAQRAVKPVLIAEAFSKITGVELPKPEEIPTEVEVGAAGAEAPLDPLDSQDPVKTGLRVKLVGTMVANRDEWSMCNIEDVTNHEVKVYMVGDHIQGAEIVRIERWRVLINNNGRLEFIDNEAGDGSSPVAANTIVPPVQNTAAPPGPAVGGGIRQTGEDTYEIEKEEINKALSNLNQIAMQARIVPAFKDGVATGFKLFSIRPDSLYSKIGIQNGDVIRRINGFEINSPDKALEVYSKLKEAGRIEIEVDRNGSSVRKTYNVR